MDITRHSFLRRPDHAGSTAGCRTGLLFVTLLGLALPVAALAITHSLLLGDTKMTAKRFAGHFQDFGYEYHPEVQQVDDFLGSRRGDCDDYALLADEVLRRRNFKTTLVHIRLAGMIAHAVCYIEEDRAYLDYNNRNVFFTLSRSSASLREIASKVADSMEANWTSASVFTYSYQTRQKQMLQTIAKTDPREKDPVPGQAPASRLLVQ